MNIEEILKKLANQENIDADEAACAMESMMQGMCTQAQTAALLTLLRVKGETVEEITEFARVMRKHAIRVTPHLRDDEKLIDTAGTGGDGSNTFNISTCAAFVAAGAGSIVAKHGNRAASSKSGSADVLEELGVKLTNSPEVAKRQLESIGIAFFFAPVFHPAMKNVAAVRKEIGFRTVFNILGPLVNPVNAKRQIIGTYDKKIAAKMVESLNRLGSNKALVVSSDIDEISISAKTEVFELNNGNIINYQVCPEDFGFKRGELAEIRAADRNESALIIRNILSGKETGCARDVVLLNSGTAIYVSGIAKDISEGIKLAEKSIDTGKALEKLELLRDYDGYS